MCVFERYCHIARFVTAVLPALSLWEREEEAERGMCGSESARKRGGDNVWERERAQDRRRSRNMTDLRGGERGVGNGPIPGGVVTVLVTAVGGEPEEETGDTCWVIVQ